MSCYISNLLDPPFRPQEISKFDFYNDAFKTLWLHVGHDILICVNCINITPGLLKYTKPIFGDNIF